MAVDLNQGYRKAIELLELNSTEYGFKAAADYKRYDSVWTRDGVICSLAAMLLKNKKLLAAARLTMETLARKQTYLGQIPRVVSPEENVANYYAVDANSWWIIGMEKYFLASGDKKFLIEYWPQLEKAVLWLKYQVKDESSLLDSPLSSDWMDSSLGRQGKVFYSNCLYYEAAECYNNLAEVLGKQKFNPLFSREKYDQRAIGELKNKIKLVFWPQEKSRKILSSWHHTEFFEKAILSRREHFLDYVSILNYDDRCDVFAQVLAVLFGIADRPQTGKILKYFEKKGVADPFPIKVLEPAILRSDDTWRQEFDRNIKKHHRNPPFCYHNGGIWPYAGGFYVLMLVKAGQKNKAKKEMEKLAQACARGKESEWEFNEWLHGETGEPEGVPLQSWSAAGYIIAYEAVYKNNLIF